MAGSRDTGAHIILVQDAVIDRTQGIFDQLKAIAVNASNQALGLEFDATTDLPEFLAVDAPSGVVGYFEADYMSDLFDALLDALLEDITTGGYGLDTNDEDRLFQRARDREQVATAAAVDEATRLYSSGGFTMPTGPAQAAKYRAQREGRDKISSINRDLASKKVDVYITAKGQALNTAVQVEQLLRTAFSAKWERSLKAAIQDLVSFIEAGIQAGNITIANAKAALDAALGLAQLELDGKKAKAALYSSLATAALSGLHANVGLSASASSGESISGNISETHSYEEKKIFEPG